MVRIEEIPVEAIVVPEKRARATFTPEQDAELEASIRTHGFTVPILVSPLPDGKYSLIDGEHRLQIARKLGIPKVPAVITEGDEKKLTLLNILANTARGSQNPMDVAEMLAKAHQAGATEDELAAATGHTRDWVHFYLMLTELPDTYKAKLRTGELKVGHIREALRLPNPLEVDSALQSTLIHKWTVEELRFYVDRRLQDVKAIYKEGLPEELPPPPTPEQAAEIVEYRTCMACNRKYPKEQMSLPMICDECRTFLEYFASQFGDTKQAMETLYKAYTFYTDAIKTTTNQPTPQTPQPTQPVTPTQPTQPTVPTSTTQPTEIDTETLALARKLKALKEAGIL